jgi:RNA polymerase sigma factor (sigma-70 family)
VPARLLRLASDERLVELLRGGSEAAFEALYVRYHRGVLSFCRHMLGSVEEAEDAVQHTFLAAYGDLVGSTKEIRLRAWLYTIARNRCLTVLRTRREQVEDAGEPATEKLSAEVERRWELRALLGDLAALPDDQRAALVLAELGDLTHDEIGVALDCPRDKVKALVFQARSSLVASREARDASCADIREQLANLRGGALRRNLLRRHVRECEGCRTFYERVRAQRRELALILPVTPSLGLKAAVLGGGGAAATSSVVAKTAIVLAVAGGGAAAVETVREERERPRPAATAPKPPAAPAAVVGAVETDDSAPAATSPVKADETSRVRRTKRSRGPARRAKKRADGRVPPGRAKKKPAAASEGFVPPGQEKRGDKPVPPGQVKKADKAVPPGQVKKRDTAAKQRVKTVSRGQAKKPVKAAPPKKPQKAAPPTQAAPPEDVEPEAEAAPPDEAPADDEKPLK